MSFISFDIYYLSPYFQMFFSKRGVDFCKSLSSIVLGMMHCGNCSTGAISTAISAFSGKSFAASEKQIRYLLSNIRFQIDDQLWRCYLRMIFSFLKEGGYISEEKKIFIQIDYTSVEDDFLILYASIVFRNKALPIYFSMRRYPKRKNIFNQIKTEQAFIKGLSHCLSKRYQYVIVADRGFGNKRFIELCEANNFGYIVRLKSDLNISAGKNINLGSLKYSKTLENIQVSSWGRSANIFVRRKDNSIWYLCSNISALERKRVVREYERRFKIEKCFFDQKSNGFNLEKTKIRKYEKLKRLVFCILVSQALMLFTGDVIKHNHHRVKKTWGCPR